MTGKLWLVQKPFFKILNKSEEILNIGYKVYGNSIPESAQFPYLSISSISILNGFDLNNSRKKFEIQISAFDNSKSSKNISKVMEIIDDILSLGNLISENDTEIKFLSLESSGMSIFFDNKMDFISGNAKYFGFIENQ